MTFGDPTGTTNLILFESESYKASCSLHNHKYKYACSSNNVLPNETTAFQKKNNDCAPDRIDATALESTRQVHVGTTSKVF